MKRPREMSAALERLFARVARQASIMTNEQIDSLIVESTLALTDATNTEIKDVAARYGVELDDGPVKDFDDALSRPFLAMALCALVHQFSVVDDDSLDNFSDDDEGFDGHAHQDL